MKNLKCSLPLAFCTLFFVASCSKQASISKLKGTWTVASIQKTTTRTNPNDPSYFWERTTTFDGTIYSSITNDNGSISSYETEYLEYSYTFNKDNTYEIKKTSKSIGPNSIPTNKVETGSYTFLSGEKSTSIKKNSRILFTILGEGNSLYGFNNKLEPGYWEYFMTIEKCTSKELHFKMIKEYTSEDGNGNISKQKIVEEIKLTK